MALFVELEKILTQERRTNYQDQAVIGGLGKYLANWASRQREVQDPEHTRRVAAILAALEGYHQADAVERAAKIARSLALARGQVERDREAGRQGSRGAEEEGEVESAPMPAPPTRPGSESAGLAAPIERLPGVGPAHAKKFAKLGVYSVRDLLYLFPRRYDDYSRLKTINQLRPGEEVTIIAKVGEVKGRRTQRGLHVTNVLLADNTGNIQATFFNQPFLVGRLKPGAEIVVSGRVETDLGYLAFKHPEWEPLSRELLHTARIVPVYPLTEGLTARWVRKLTRDVVRQWATRLPDPLPEPLRQRAHLADLATALREIHFPGTLAQMEAARRRLAFEEFLLIQIGVLRQRRQWRQATGAALNVDPAFVQQFVSTLPFQLTGAQQRALNELLGDLKTATPMSRLLQGDVGSGKTVVATAGMLVTVANGAQAVLMAPTEILAEQHHHTISSIVANLPQKPRVELLTGSLRAREKKEIREELATGAIDIAVGTHALIQEGVEFKNLALAVIDEQHRFGVEQRAAIRQRGTNPHILVMSATPIPRTLALTVYGDLDLSIIDEMPPGRREIKTRVLTPRERERAYQFIRKEVNAGRQVFIILPLIEESEAIEAKAAVEEHERLSRDIFPDFKLGLLHGRMRPADKDAVMAKFRGGELNILVSTSVVEVGIDVPNATVMLIENAERFGLAQLHQFRGRVGRGAFESYCILICAQEDNERVKVIESVHNGFRLAEEDLKLRGPGEFFGTRQSGLPDLKVAKLADVKILEEARTVAQELFEQDPDLARAEHQLLAQKVREFWRGEGDLS